VTLRLEPVDTPGVRVAVTGSIAHLCPYVDELDEGQVTVTWVTGPTTIELHSLADYLARFKAERVSHEELVTIIADDLTELGLPAAVTGRFTTAGLYVEVSSAVPGDPLVHAGT
jgi:NADPH-dependent 7-cyano-7-deazaguanine reductase QueF